MGWAKQETKDKGKHVSCHSKRVLFWSVSDFAFPSQLLLLIMAELFFCFCFAVTAFRFWSFLFSLKPSSTCTPISCGKGLSFFFFLTTKLNRLKSAINCHGFLSDVFIFTKRMCPASFSFLGNMCLSSLRLIRRAKGKAT